MQYNQSDVTISNPYFTDVPVAKRAVLGKLSRAAGTIL